MQYWKDTCDRGYGESCKNIGGVHFHNKQMDQAKTFLKKACDECKKPYPAACVMLSDVYNDGSDDSNTDNLAESLKYAEKACDIGVLDGCKKLYKHYKSMPHANEMQALKYADKGCDLHSIAGCKVLYDYYSGMAEDDAKEKAKIYKDKIKGISGNIKYI